jgi:translation elongation factor EF-Tu-like GTPase
MKLKVNFTALAGVRKTPIFTNYRPDWKSIRKPEYNCAVLTFTEMQKITPGDTAECMLTPMRPDLWTVEIGDIIDCMEGSRKVGEAEVLEISS